MITHFNLDDLARNLPDAYKKTPESNNSKILRIEKSAMDDLRSAIQAVSDSLELDKATGKTLDLYGSLVGQERGKATDEQYRMLIKSRIVRNLCNGDYNSIVRLLSVVFGCDPADIVLNETDTPCHVRLESMPYDVLNRLVIDIDTALKIIEEVMPVGVYLESIQFTGTFEFGDTSLEYDEAAGFGNEAQTVGGVLGYIFSEISPELPV